MPSDSKVIERRRHPRRPFACAVSCLPTEGEGAGTWWDAMVLDISRGGLQIVSGRWFEPRDILKVRLGGDEGKTAVVVIVRVIRVSAAADGQWLLGCQMLPELGDEEFKKVLAKKKDTGAGPQHR